MVPTAALLIGGVKSGKGGKGGKFLFLCN